MKVELTSDEIDKISIALGMLARSRIIIVPAVPLDCDILNAADDVKLARRLLKRKEAP